MVHGSPDTSSTSGSQSLGGDRDRLRLVVAGGGVAGLEALIGTLSLCAERVEAVLVADRPTFVYRAMKVGEPFGRDRAREFDLAELCTGLGATFVEDRVDAVHAGAHMLRTTSGRSIGYDVLVLALGARPYDAFEHGVSFHPDRAPAHFAETLSAARDGFVDHVAIIVPDGASWPLPAYELALRTAGYARRSCVTLLTYETAPLEMFGATASREVERILKDGDVSLRTGVHADVVTPTALRAGGAWLNTGRIVSLPLLQGVRITGVPCDPHGFIPVDDAGRVEGVEDVYAAGDGTTLPIKQGGLAAQQADIIAQHIAARLDPARTPTRLRPVLRGVLLAPDGARYLRADLHDRDGTSTISREPLWWPASKVASRWLAPHLAHLPDPTHAPSTTEVTP